MKIVKTGFEKGQQLFCQIPDPMTPSSAFWTKLFGVTRLASGDLDREERMATVGLLAEILFPNTDNKGFPGLDLKETEEVAGEASPEAKETLARMDGEEATFAAASRRLLEQKGLTQEKLTEKVGIGQPAISMMLQRKCRPQKRPLARLADALDVSAEELWPIARGKQWFPLRWN